MGSDVDMSVAAQTERGNQFRERRRRYLRGCHYRSHYGISLTEYEAILAGQGARCALCGSAEPGGGKSNFAVDHNHATGKVRGLLCMGCNLFIGYLERWWRGNPNRVDAAVQYAGLSGHGGDS